MNDIRKLAYYFKNYSRSLQTVVHTKTGNFFHDHQNIPVQLVYLCPLCLKNKIAILHENQHLDCEFTLDHFPPFSIGGKDTVLVCKDCNYIAGLNFEYELKNFVREIAATQWILGTKIPVSVNVEDVQGNYKAHLIVKGPYSFEWSFPNYPLLTESFKKMQSGQPTIQNITFKKRELELVYKSLLKAAYLYCFSRWKYDFAYSYSGAKIRGVILKDESHPLTNGGVFFHTKGHFPPQGLCYIFKPKELQSFMVTFSLKDKETGFSCMASVLVPGADDSCWENMKNYQPIIDKQEAFTNAFILLPSDLVPSENHFPYTATWKSRTTFKIAGENDI